MEILDFLEQYWGVAIFGGTTVGLVITNVWFLVKGYLKQKTTNALFNTALDAVDNVLRQNHEKEYAQAQLMLENDYYKSLSALTFKYLNYLTVSSKLPPDKKTELVEESKVLQLNFQSKMGTLVEAIKEDAIEKVQEIVAENKETAVSIVGTAVDEASSLLEKYTKEE